MVKIVIENLAQKELSFIEPPDWMQACGGKGRCTTCKMIVMKGMENLSPPTPVEVKYRSQHQLSDNERLACQTRVYGYCKIRVPEESKMPHLVYTS